MQFVFFWSCQLRWSRALYGLTGLEGKDYTLNISGLLRPDSGRMYNHRSGRGHTNRKWGRLGGQISPNKPLDPFLHCSSMQFYEIALLIKAVLWECIAHQCSSMRLHCANILILECSLNTESHASHPSLISPMHDNTRGSLQSMKIWIWSYAKLSCKILILQLGAMLSTLGADCYIIWHQDLGFTALLWKGNGHQPVEQQLFNAPLPHPQLC